MTARHFAKCYNSCCKCKNNVNVERLRKEHLCQVCKWLCFCYVRRNALRESWSTSKLIQRHPRLS